MSFLSAIKLFFTKKDKISTVSNNNKEKKKTSIFKINKMNSINSSSSSYNNSSREITTATTAASSTSTGQNFQFRDGRRYHDNKDVAYLLPNDDDEADRVHQQHWILRYALQCNFHAPVTDILEKGAVVLDSGCGPATWTFEMGETYPRSKFHGIDISRVFPGEIKPANVEFVIGNIAKDIPFPDNTFDYIHQRLLILGLTHEDWESSLKELYRVLRPGGYIELAEPDLQDLYNMGPQLKKMQYTMSGMLKFRGMPPKVACELEDRLIKVGFVNAETKVKPLNINHTDKAGDLLWADYRHLYMNSQPVLAKFHPEWQDAKAFEVYLDDCGAEAKELKTGANWYASYAQKPLE